jgi:hypothetical protein
VHSPAERHSHEGTHDAASRRKTIGSYVKDLITYDEGYVRDENGLD